jgi:hypothetical protein
VSSILSKKQTKKQVDLRYHSSKVKFIHLFFGKNVDLKKSFQLCLTFSKQDFDQYTSTTKSLAFLLTSQQSRGDLPVFLPVDCNELNGWKSGISHLCAVQTKRQEAFERKKKLQ